MGLRMYAVKNLTEYQRRAWHFSFALIWLESANFSHLRTTAPSTWYDNHLWLNQYPLSALDPQLGSHVYSSERAPNNEL
jgi:hypothetical protein